MKYFIIIIISVLYSTDTLAQQFMAEAMPRQKFFTTTLGLTWQTRKDNLFSPLSYTGYGAELHVGFERINDQWFKQFDLWGNVNRLQSRIDNGYNSLAYGFRYGAIYTVNKRIAPNQSKFKLYVGGSVFHTSSMGYYEGNVNNIFSFNIPTGIAASGFLSRDLRLFRRNWSLSTQLTMPILSYNARPTYLGFVEEENFLEDFGIVSFNKLLYFDWRWQIDLPLSNGNRLRAIYRWDYMDDRHVGRLRVGTQTFLIQSLFNIPFRKVKPENKSNQ